MNKRIFLMLSIVLLCMVMLLARRSVRAQTPPANTFPVGAVVAHFSCRLVRSNGDFEMIGYSTFAEAPLATLFGNPSSERTAPASFRSDRFQLSVIPNGDALQVRRQPADDGSIPRIHIYFDPAPNRDFDQPDSFSTGLEVGVLRARNTQGILVPERMFHLVGSVEIESAAIPAGDQTLARSGLPGSLTISIDGVPPSQAGMQADGPLSIPFSMTAVAAEAFPATP